MKNLLLTTLILSAAVARAPASAAEKTPPATARNIVLVPGAFADESSWDNVAAILKARGYRVDAVKLPLTSLEDDVRATQAVLDAQVGPTVLVGHSWGGFVIGEAGVDSKVTALVYVSAFAPDRGESITKLSAGGPPSPGVQAIRPNDKGFLSIDKAAFPMVFGADLPKTEAEILAGKQKPINHTAFDEPARNAAWHNKPSWFVVSNKDLLLEPSTQNFFADRMNATKTVVQGGHDTLIAFPKQVAVVIEDAATAAAKK
jgi:pimeloyl-ACP methyl ester carboxylesterase